MTFSDITSLQDYGQEEPLHFILVHSDQEAVVVNLDIAPAEESETVWIGPNHLAAG